MNKTTKIRYNWLILYIPVISVIAVICITQLEGLAMSPTETIFYTVLAGLILAFLIWVLTRPFKLFNWISKHLKEKWRKKHAFTFTLDGSFEKIKKLKTPIGQSAHFFWIKQYKDIELQGFTIRFVPTRGIGEKCRQIPSSIVSINKAELKWDSTDNTVYKTRKDVFKEEEPIGNQYPSKWHCWFDAPILRGPRLPIGIKINIDIKKHWKGYFSIESRLQRQYGRIKVKVAGK